VSTKSSLLLILGEYCLADSGFPHLGKMEGVEGFWRLWRGAADASLLKTDLNAKLRLK
jgi:hypothetical protein